MLWIAATAGAASLQVARNALQRGLLAEAGPWGATLSRFLFGLPFSLALLAVVWAAGPRVAPQPGLRFLIACAACAMAQLLATAAMLVSMRRSSFALGSAFQQSSIPLAALMGLLFGEHLPASSWIGIVLVSVGMVALAWPRGPVRDWSAGVLGLAAGLGFAVSANAARQAGLALEPAHPVFAAIGSVLVVQAMQTVGLVAVLLATNRSSLAVVFARWRESLPAGFFGAAASSLWFTAFRLHPAGPVRAVGVIELPLAALAGRRAFAERLRPAQIAWIALVGIGVVLAAR